jgi:hypothetical protein
MALAMGLVAGVAGLTLWTNQEQAEARLAAADRAEATAYARRTCDTLESELAWRTPTADAMRDFYSQLHEDWLWAIVDECPTAYDELLDAVPASA